MLSVACENIPFHFHYRPKMGKYVVSVHIFMQELKHVSENLYVNVKLF